jgi:hypothetical protein
MNALFTNDRRWKGLALGLVLGVMAHLAATNNTSRNEEPWPMLLSADSVGVDPVIALLHQRASGALERLVQSGSNQEPL